MKITFIKMATVAFFLSSSLASLALAQNPGVDFAGGSGTASSPYLISNKEQLSNLRNYLGATHGNKCYKLTQDIEFSPADFAEGGPFYNSGQGWQPIGVAGAKETSFTGKIDGNGKVIRGLVCKAKNVKCAGLFQALHSAAIQNLSIENADISLISSVDSVNAAILAAYSTSTNISNCVVSGKVEASTSMNEAIAGGLIGVAERDFSIINSKSEGSLTINNSTTVSGKTTHAGGLIGSYGKGTGSTGTLEEVSCRNCSSTMSVSSETTSTGTSYVGGLMGEIYYGNVESSFSSGNVSGKTSSKNLNLGGLIGAAESGSDQIINSYSSSVVSAASDSAQGEYRIGGFIGYSNISIVNCYSNGGVTVMTPTADTLVIAGGFAGYVQGIMSKSYSTAPVSVTAQGAVNAGGFAGTTSIKSSGYQLSGCYAAGNVVVYSSKESVNTGGFTGYLTSDLKDCYATGSVNASSAGMTNTVKVKTGGMAGYGNGASITNCYASGDINSISQGGNRNYVGGILGSHYSGTIGGCFVLSNNIKSNGISANINRVLGATESSYPKKEHNRGLSRTMIRYQNTIQDSVASEATGFDGQTEDDVANRVKWEGIGFMFSETDANPWKWRESGYPKFYWGYVAYTRPPHNADINGDWSISETELSRVISLYNGRTGNTRTGQYHAQEETEDGYNPGSAD